MKIDLINPINFPGWDDLLQTNPESSFFHTAAWAKVLSDSYGYQPLYFTHIGNNRLTGLIPVMEVNSMLTGKRGVSLSFTDQCEPMAEDQNTFEELLNQVIDYGKKAGWKTMQLRGGDRFLKDKTASGTFLSHDSVLRDSPEQMLSSFRNSTQRNIKKSEKLGVTVKVLHSRNAVIEFYRLNCLTHKDHGLPSQPFKFFKALYDQAIAKKKGLIVLAHLKDLCIAGAVFFHFGQEAIYKYGASNKNYQHLRANNLVMWEAIKQYAKDGLKIFNFGRTELEHQGLQQFKRGWGTTERKLRYYTYDFSEGAFIKNISRIKSSYSILTKMPIPLLKLAGRMLYRHMG